MTLIKRQFLDSLYNHPKGHKNIFSFKKNGYTVNLTPKQVISEIDKETEIGKELLRNIEIQEKILINLSSYQPVETNDIQENQ